MGALRAVALAVLLALTTPAGAARRVDPLARWQPFIAQASQRFGVPQSWIVRVMRAESAGLTHIDGQPIRSRAGAIGLMQLMPATWAEMRARLGLGPDPDDPHDNILAGTLYLRLMYDHFGYPGLFAAYNAGPARYAEHLARGRPLPAETRGYLASLAPSASSVAPSHAADALFFPVGTRKIGTEPTASGLFVSLTTVP